MLKWYEKSGKNDDVIISSRLRLARNFNNYMFADKLSYDDATTMVNSVARCFANDFSDNYECIFMNNCDDVKKNALKEKRIISSYLAGGKNGAVLLSRDESVSVSVNAEDHIRIQVLSNGMNLQNCFKKANEIDDYIDSNFDYAFDEKYGYKTTYPTNTGTGMKAGYTLHLPALTDAKRITDIGTELGRFGYKIKNVYGDGQNVYGHLYQIASQKTLGQEEQEIIRDLDDIVIQIVNQEREQREYFYKKDKIQMEDEIFKSYGVLKYARKLSLKDAMLLISEFMVGLSLGVLSTADAKKLNVNELIMNIQPAVLNSRTGKSMSVAETDIARAQYIRTYIPEII